MLPGAPANLQAAAGDGQVTLSWTPVAGASSYNLYLGLATGVTPASGSAFQGATSPQVLSGLSVGSTYYFVVTAVNAAGEGPASNEASAAPYHQDTAAPKLLFIRPTQGSLGVDPAAPVTVAFSEAMDDASVASGISLSGAVSGPVTGTFSQSAGRVTFTPGAALNLSESYTVSVGAGVTDLAGNALGAPASVTFTVRPAAPTGLAAIKGNSAVSLSWSAVAGATAYTVYRGTATGGPYTAIGSSPGLDFTDRSPTNGTTYFYVVTGTTAAGESGYSNEASAQPSGVNQAATPQNLHADPGNTEALITWDSTAAADKYFLFRGTARGGPYAPLASNLTSVTYRDTGLTNGTRYYYVVQSKSSSTTSAYSAEATVVPQATLLPSPANLSAAVGTTWVQLTWDAVPGASAYVVYQVTDHQQHVTVSAGVFTNQALITGLSDGSPYSFSVAALNAASQPGAPSNEVTVNPTFALAPRQVLQLQGWSVGNGNSHLEWPAAPGATGYKIKRGSASGGPYAVISTTSGTTFDDNNLSAGTYFYVVQATSNSGNASAADSAEVAVTPAQAASQAPSNITTQAGNGCITLTWNVVPGANWYYLTYGTASGGPYNSAGSTRDGYDNQYTFCGLQNGAPYYFRIQAYYSRSGTYGPLSSEVAAAPSASSPSAPYTPGFVPGNGQLFISWNAVAAATGYHLYRRTDTTPWTEIAAPTQLSYVDTGLVNNTRYFYEVQSENGFGRGEVSSYGYKAPDGNLPLPPASVTTQAGNSCATLSWSLVPGASWYYITYGTQTGGPYNSAGSTRDGYDNQYTFCGLQNGAPYYFVVQAYSSRTGTYNGYSAEVLAVPSNSLPSAPYTPSFVPAPDELHVEWNSVAAANSYHLYRRTETSPWAEIAAPSLPNYEDPGLQSGTRYYYEVQSENGFGRGEISSYAYRTPDTNLPAPPTNLTAQPGNSCVTTHWDVVPGAAWYYVTYGTQQGGPYNSAGSTRDGYDNQYTFCGLQNGSPYYFVVQAYFTATGNYTGYSAEAVGVPSSSLPSAPYSPSGTRGDSQVAVSWYPVAGVTGYHLYRRTATTPWAELAAPSQPNYLDLEVVNDVQYFYEVQSEGSGGRGEISGASNFTPSATLGQAPTNPTALAGNTCASVSWDPVPGAAWYYVTYGTASGGPYNSAGSTRDGYDNQYTFCGLQNGAPYYFVVQAYFSAAGNYSGYSPEVSATPSGSVPSAPYLYLSPGAAGEGDLTWTAASGALGYRIYRRTEGASTWVVIAEVTSTSYIDHGLSTGTHYDYALQAYGAGGAGEISTSVAFIAP